MNKMLLAIAVLLNITLPTPAQIRNPHSTLNSRKINIGDTVVFRDEQTLLDYLGKATTVGTGAPTVGIVTDISTDSDDPNAPLQYFIDYKLDQKSAQNIGQMSNLATVPITNTNICKLRDYKSIADLGKIELPKLSAKEIANIAKHNNSYKLTGEAGKGEPERSRGSVIVNKNDGSTLILIPAGEFTMGPDDGDYDKAPSHTVYLDAYYIGKYEVTNAQYKKFCDATGHSHPLTPDFESHLRPRWSGGDYFTEYPNYPVVNVTWEDAKAYCDWAGLRLPTEAEWEKAARGTDGRTYPWGNEWDASKCNSLESRKYQPTPVGSFPQGASPYGVMDMAGNVCEWCADWWGENYYQNTPNRNPTGPSSGSYRVLRGGSWFSWQDNCFTSFRGEDWPQGRGDYLGFRCAR